MANKTISQLPLSTVSTLNDEILINQDGSTKRIALKDIVTHFDDIVEGYYFEGSFYKDSEHTQIITPKSDILYSDIPTGELYKYVNNAYIKVSGELLWEKCCRRFKY